MLRTMLLDEFAGWLIARGVSEQDTKILVSLSGVGNLFEPPQRIMQPDDWFYYPSNRRFILLGTCPNGDAIAPDTLENRGAIFFICRERVHEIVADSEVSVCVAETLDDYLNGCTENPDFPQDFRDAENDR